MSPLACPLIVLLALLGCWMCAAQEPQPVHVWHLDEAQGEQVREAQYEINS